MDYYDCSIYYILRPRSSELITIYKIELKCGILLGIVEDININCGQ